MSYRDHIDQFLGSIGDRAVALDRAEPPFWIDATARLVLKHPIVEVVPDHEVERLGPLTSSLAYTLTRLGAASRRAACEAFGELQADPAVTQMILNAADELTDMDWWGRVCVVARTLMEVGDGTFSVPETQVLTPVRLRPELRDRLGTLMVESVLYDEHGEMRELGTLSTASLRRCWYFGYCLSACRASLPDDAARELSAVKP